jgi:glycosyltransferase involved in cell wall biosynthesis
MRPLKIALFSRWYWEENRRSNTPEGGAVQQLTEAVAELGHEVVVLSQSPHVRTLEKTQIGKLETWLFPRDKKRDLFTGLRDKWAKRTYRHRKLHSDALALGDFLARRGPFDVLWAQCEEPDGLVAGFARQLGITLPPLLVQIYALRYRFENGVPIFQERPALQLAFRYADRIVASSELVAEHLSAYAGGPLSAGELQARTHLVAHNLQREFFRAAGETTVVPVAEPQRVLFFGALNEKKGAAVFMDAVRKTDAAKKGAVFAVTGNFTEKNPQFVQRWNETLETTRSQIAPAQLELLGKIPPTEAIRQIQRASVVVLPSLFDEFSRALVEALILGRPVITTKTVGAWPLVNEHVCGLVVQPNDSTALAQAIDDVLAPGTHYAVNAQRVAHRLLHEYTPEAIARQMAHHLAEIAGT